MLKIKPQSHNNSKFFIKFFGSTINLIKKAYLYEIIIEPGMKHVFKLTSNVKNKISKHVSLQHVYSKHVLVLM